MAPPGFGDVSLCGSGATSHVFKATDRRSGRTVALKRLHRHLVRDDEAVARLRRELIALQRLRHPSIVPVRDLIQWQRQPTIVMDFVEGEDLKARILRKGPLPFALVDRVARALLEALATAHGAGIVHRDIKPQNVRVSSEDRIYLLDFGSARLDASAQLTASGTTVGTPEYMAPELFSGSVYDPRVDIYGVGATLFECLTARPPVTADSLAELAFRRARTDTPSVIDARPETPEGLARLVDRSLARAPEARFASAARALWALDHPEEERARAYRKSAQPPCLHCGAPLPVDAGFCPHCGSERPFAFSAGSHTIRLTGVQDAARFVELLADRFPERTRPRHLKALAQAALLAPTARPVLIADIAEGQAAKLAADLDKVGVATETTARARLETRAIASLAVAFFVILFSAPLLSLPMLLLLGANVFIAALIGNELLQASAPGGLLADRGSRVVVAPHNLRRLAVAGALLGLAYVPIAHAAASVYFLENSFGSAFGAAGVLATAAALVGAIGILATKTWGGRDVRPPLSAAPSFWERLFVRARGQPVARPPARARAIASAVFAIGVLVVVPLEVAILEALPRMSAPSAAAPVAPVDLPSRSPQSGLESPIPVGGPYRGQPATVPIALRWLLMWPTALPLGLAGALLLGWVFVLRRKLQLGKDAGASLEGIDRERLIRAGRRTPPSSRRSMRCLPSTHGDGFAGSAIRHAAELESGLSTEDAAQLWSAVEEVAAAGRSTPREQRSLTARCILESDPDQQLRFEFLRLAGELETRAARTWLGESIETSDGEDQL